MEPEPANSPLIVIVGETASGKTALAIELAQRFGGEIIAADSRTVYKGMDISTAKPAPEEREIVPHHLLDVVEPNQRFSAADFKRLANEAIEEIEQRGNIPFLVGGSGLYIDAVLYDFEFRGEADDVLRAELQALSIEQLQLRIEEDGLPMPENRRNPRHLIRTLETGGAVVPKKPLRPSTLVLGIEVEREVLRTRIASRVDGMVEQGLLREIKHVADEYGWDAPALQAPGCGAFRNYFEGNLELDEAIKQFTREHVQLAKRQRTWFRRNKDVRWICKTEEAVDLVTTLLNKQSTAMP
jgi:tRNA dimethylallyltransferase